MKDTNNLYNKLLKGERVTIRNPDNNAVFDIIYFGYGFPTYLAMYEVGKKRKFYGPLMNRHNLKEYLENIEEVNDPDEIREGVKITSRLRKRRGK